jgi:hypothetical protein
MDNRLMSPYGTAFAMTGRRPPQSCWRVAYWIIGSHEMKRQRHNEITPASRSASRWWHQVFVVVLSTIIALTMISWLIFVGWGAVEVVKWVFS